MGESPEAIHVVNQLRLAAETDRIGDRSARILEQAANRILRDLSVTQGPASRLALQAQLAQIDAIFQAAGADAYQRFVEDVLKKQQAWTGRSEKEVQANLESAVDQGLMAQSTAQAGPAAGQALGSLYRGQQAILSEQALRVASTMPALELAVVGSQKQPYSLQKEFANAFLQPDGKSTAQAFQAQVDRLQETFERSVRQAVVTGQTTQALVRDLKGDGQAITGSMRAPIEQIRSVARTGAQSVANAIQDSQLQENSAVEFVEFVATLDSRTSPVCRATDGNVYKKGSHPVPPLHFRCRSTITAFIPGREEGSRSMTMLVEDENGRVKSYGAYSPAIKGRLSERQEALLRKNQSGKPPSYEEWLRAQPAAAQDGILGRRNGEKFRANDGRLTTTTTPGVKRQLGAMPKPLTAAQIKPKKKPKLSKADLANPLRQDPPKTPPAPAGSGGGAVVATPKTPKKPIPAKPKAKPAAKPKSSQTTTAASAKPAVPAKAAAGGNAPEVTTPKTPAPTPAVVERQAAQKKANAVAAKAKQELELGPINASGELMDDAELEQALMAASKKTVAKKDLPATTVDPRYKINPQMEFEESEDRLGSGVFGSVNRTKNGVVKRGMFTKPEITALEELSDSGVTPRVKGLSWEDKTPDFKAGAMGGGIKTRRGYLLMEEAKGQPITKLVSKKDLIPPFDTAERNLAFTEFIKARKEIHLRGFSHQDMHGGNVLWDGDAQKINIVDLGLARKDPRSALVEAIGTRRGRMNFGQIEKPGDYQSAETIKELNQGRALTGNKTWKQFEANRKKVEKLLADAGVGEAMSKASIRSLPTAITKAISKDRATELLEMLYEGI